jgi:acyl-CoA thioesterase
VPTRFDRDIALSPAGDGDFDVRIDEGWWVMRGPNGGYVAALLANAFEAAVADPARTLRSLTVHYLRPPRAGAAHIETRIERAGRGLTSATARLVQEGALLALAIAAFGVARPGPELNHAEPPVVPPPSVLPPRGPAHVPIHARYDQRFAIGPRYFDGERGREAVTGGWIRLAEDRRAMDAALLAAYADAWPPAVFGAAELPQIMGGVPTIDLTVHVRAGREHWCRPDEYALVVFRTREVRDGFLEEDGEIWSPRGILLAQSRQLALVL